MEENGIIEALPDDASDNWGEGTSDYDESVAETTFGSLTSTVTGHIWEYGRRYHAFRPGRYPMPNDDEEYKREALRHAMLKELLQGKLFLAPIGSHPQKILDLGTGFGEWAIEVGELFPGAKVTGLDLSPIQPVWVPPNVEFIVDDIEDEWVHDNNWDFAHFRVVNILLKDNDRVLTKVLENLKPGGWVEIQEIYPWAYSDDDSLPADYAPNRFYSLTEKVLKDHYGFDIKILDNLVERLTRLGFVNAERKVYHMPLGEWPRNRHLRVLGGCLREVFFDLLAAMAAKPFIEAGYEREEIEELVNETKAALNNRRFHAYVPIHFVWAQKPPA
ncbi:S-adenosyl-L-methionine-dependent methyltransferase [Cladorrhinum sp. PSN259]|nr:S-adenosyl-L-methionine-dependent methyltransferase [Cladorrhinum sp. PSN259]